jgi:hypothetical protein
MKDVQSEQARFSGGEWKAFRYRMEGVQVQKEDVQLVDGRITIRGYKMYGGGRRIVSVFDTGCACPIVCGRGKIYF